MKNCLLIVFALLIGLLVSEVAMRLAGFHPRTVNINRFFIPGTETTWSVPDPELGWINKAGISRSIEEGEAPMTFWDYSRRASRQDPAPQGGLPVMVIGGSNAQSYGVRVEETFVSLLAFDSVQGPWREAAAAAEGEAALVACGRRIGFSAHARPEDIPWGDLGVDVVLECTGRFLSPETLGGHLARGARRVVVRSEEHTSELQSH